MKEIVIRANEAEQRLDKFLKKYFKEAPASFLYKMLRKKNIVLNGKKASGEEKLHNGDTVGLFLAEETIAKFRGMAEAEPLLLTGRMPDIVYENAHVLMINKPAGMLSQKAKMTDESLVEYVTQYLLAHHCITTDQLRTFKPAVCNRLDRNTSGLIVAGKSLCGLQTFSALFKERTIQKYYLAIVAGKVTKPAHICGLLVKDAKTNQVRICKPDGRDKKKEELEIETEYVPVACCKTLSLLKVHLITGKTHQIRAHLAAEDHPIIGDYKYGSKKVNDRYKKEYGIQAQLLHAYELLLPQMEGTLQELSNRQFCAPVPEVFTTVIGDTAWEHGTQEALEVLR